MPAIVGAEFHEVSTVEWEGSGEAFEVGAWGPVLVAPVSSRHGDRHLFVFLSASLFSVCVDGEEGEAGEVDRELVVDQRRVKRLRLSNEGKKRVRGRKNGEEERERRKETCSFFVDVENGR